MPQPVPKIEKMDGHMLDVVRALHGDVKQCVSHSKDLKIMDKAINDCKEILDVIMAGKVQEWLN